CQYIVTACPLTVLRLDSHSCGGPRRLPRRGPVNRLLYAAYHANLALTAPARFGSAAALKLLEARPDALRSPFARHLAAASTVVAGNRLTHARPDFERGVPFIDADGH